MNFKTTLALVALAALVGAYFWFFERGATPTYEIERAAREAVEQEGDRLFPAGLEADSITAFTIERDGQTARIEKQDNAWVQVEPVRFPLNDYRPQQVVDQAVALRFVSRFRPGENDQPTAADLGLEDPRATLTLITDDGEHVVKLGKPSSGGRAYAMIGGDANVYVVDDTLHNAVLTGQVSDWRKRSFTAPQVGQLERVTLRRDGQTHVIRKIDGRWFLDEAGTQRVDAEKLRSLVSEASGFYISEFVSDDRQKLSYYGLEEPRASVTLVESAVEDAEEEPEAGAEAEGESGDDAKPQAARTHTLRIGAPADLKGDSFYATWSTGDESSQVVFSINKSVAEKITQPIDDLRDARIVLAEADKVRELRIARGEGDVIHLEKTPEKWVFGDPAPEFDPDQEAAPTLIRAFTGARATGYTQDPPTEPVAAEVAIHVTGGTGAERLVIHGPRESGDASSYVVIREDEPIGYLIEADQLAPAFEPIASLRDKTVLRADLEQLASVTLTQPDGATLTFQRQAASEGEGKNEGESESGEATWTLQGAESFEQDAWRGLADALRAVRAESWATDRSAFNPDATVALAMKDGATRTLRVETGSRRGQLDGVEPLFVLPQVFVDRLTAEYRDRLVLPLAMDQIASVTIDDGEKRVTLSRDGSNYVDESGARVDQAAAAGAFDTLANLRVERYLPASAATIAEDARVTITVTRKEGDPAVLTLDEANDVATLQGRDGAFRLGEDRRKKLLAPLTAPTPEETDAADDDAYMGK